MGRKLSAFIGINLLLIIFGAVFFWFHYNPEPFNDIGMSTIQPSQAVTNV